MIEAEREGENCPNCGGAIAIRNPTGKCDHLHYPENVPGYVSERSALLRCEEALRGCRPWVHEEMGLAFGNHKRARLLLAKIDAALTLLDEARHGK